MKQRTFPWGRRQANNLSVIQDAIALVTQSQNSERNAKLSPFSVQPRHRWNFSLPAIGEWNRTTSPTSYIRRIFRQSCSLLEVRLIKEQAKLHGIGCTTAIITPHRGMRVPMRETSDPDQTRGTAPHQSALPKARYHFLKETPQEPAHFPQRSNAWWTLNVRPISRQPRHVMVA